MQIQLKQIKIADLVKGYTNNEEDGVIGFDGKLNIRPPYQREFVYNNSQRASVIKTIVNNWPLNVMYWAVNADGYEIIDGQQRTLSICSYVNGDFAVNYRFFHNLEKEEQDQILNYEILVYLCIGSSTEKLEWFRVINIAGEKLNEQELRNAAYVGPWLLAAKAIFSKNNCPAWNVGKHLVNGVPNRQDYLETALKWISNNEAIESYMAKHQHHDNANDLWMYFQNVVKWVDYLFDYRKEMKGIQWGLLYNTYSSNQYNVTALREQVTALMSNEDVTNKKGIYEYVLSGVESKLNVRAFTDSMKRTVYEQQGGKCAISGVSYPFEEMEGDHIIPFSKGGKTSLDNLQMIHKSINRQKSNK